MKVIKIISETPISLGCVIREEIWETPGYEVVPLTENAGDAADELIQAIENVPEEIRMISGYNSENQYIGNEGFARRLCDEKGIKPEFRTPDSGTCSIGFCEAENKWYGWSHRAIYGFGIGSTCKRGDCAYNAPNAEAYGQQVLDFFCDEECYLSKAHTPHVNADGERGVLVTSIYSDDVPNEKLRGTQYRHFSQYPEKFGRGEWVAETMAEAKEMACDFADSVS